MKPAEIEAGVVRLLLAVPAGVKPHTGEMRRAIGCSPSELGDAIQRMRWRGKIEMNRLALTPSMRADAEAGQAGDAEQDSAAVEQERGDQPPAPDAEAPAGQAGKGDGGADAAAPPSSARIPEASKGAILLAEIEDYCSRTSTPEHKVGAVAFRHPGYVGLLRKRGSVTAEKAAAVRALLAEHPGGLADVEAENPRLRVPKPAPAPAPAGAPAADRADEGDRCVQAWEPASALRAEIETYLERTGTLKTVFGRHCANDTAMLSRLAAAATVSAVKAARARALMAAHPDGIEVVRHKRRGRIPVPHHEFSLVERFQGALVEKPEDMIRAIQLTHDELWQRVVLLGRALKVRPGQALYMALGAGLDCLEEGDGDDAAGPAHG